MVKKLPKLKANILELRMTNLSAIIYRNHVTVSIKKQVFENTKQIEANFISM